MVLIFGMSIPIPNAIVAITKRSGDDGDVNSLMILSFIEASVQLWNMSTSRLPQASGAPAGYVKWSPNDARK